MNLFDAIEWIKISEEDLYSAKILMNQVRKPLEIICYLCAQSAEKLLKGFITYHNIEPKKTHDIIVLWNICMSIDNKFKTIKRDCVFVNNYISDIRYPNRSEVDEAIAKHCIKCVEKIMVFLPIKNLINEVENRIEQ